MQRDHAWLAAVFAVAAMLLLSACGQKAPPPSAPKPVTLEKIDGGSISRITLTDQAAKRIDLRTDEIRDEDDGGTRRRVMPYAALVYDLKGDTWAYTSPQPLTYIRQSVSVESIKGGVAYLKDGPPGGTRVVTVGVAELYGAEFGIGK
jgi:hypothetical protein